jgi:hypothetical protein
MVGIVQDRPAPICFLFPCPPPLQNAFVPRESTGVGFYAGFPAFPWRCGTNEAQNVTFQNYHLANSGGAATK